jgi:hypothetical protein
LKKPDHGLHKTKGKPFQAEEIETAIFDLLLDRHQKPPAVKVSVSR